MIPTNGRAALAALAALLLCARPLPAQEPAKPASRPATPVYDERADAKADVAAAVARAAADNKRVLVVFGGNWCGWCVKLHDHFKKEAAVAKLLREEYEVVRVDVGRFDKNMDLVAGAAAAMKEKGVPYLAVLDGAGAVVALQDTGSLEAGPKHDAAKVAAFLESKKAPPLDAEEVMKAAAARARAEGKLLLAHFGAPWCGWCHKFEAFVARKEIAPLLAQDYVDVKIDLDRMTHGKDVQAKYRKGAEGGIPWIWIMTPDGETLATSDAAGGNIGHPYKPEEVEHFMGMIEKTSKRLSAEGKAALKAALLGQEAADKAAAEGKKRAEAASKTGG